MVQLAMFDTGISELNSSVYTLSDSQVKPFLKWAGGKSQLLDEIRKVYPKELGKSIKKYAEPFVGGGAVLFDILSSYEMERVYISDTNSELINAYTVIRDNLPELIKILEEAQEEYLGLDITQRKRYYYAKRTEFNLLKEANDGANRIERAALFIFLNKTCYNGLYRVNQRGLFNVPVGSYRAPKICDADNLRNISKALQKVEITCADYKYSSNFIDDNTFVYFDPPYRPISDTSNFTSYTEQPFDDKAQIELARFVFEMDRRGAKILISNSDPTNTDKNDDFFDRLYSSFNTQRVKASRMISCDGATRGKISELLITNY